MTLYDMYLNSDDEAIQRVTVVDGTSRTFPGVFEAMEYYGEERKINMWCSETEPDEAGEIKLILEEPQTDEADSYRSLGLCAANYH